MCLMKESKSVPFMKSEVSCALTFRFPKKEPSLIHEEPSKLSKTSQGKLRNQFYFLHYSTLK